MSNPISLAQLFLQAAGAYGCIDQMAGNLGVAVYQPTCGASAVGSSRWQVAHNNCGWLRNVLSDCGS
jgi:hypothetical protein